MKISVIVRAGDTEYTQRCVDSLLAQSFERGEFEIVLTGRRRSVKPVYEKYLSEDADIKYSETDPEDFARVINLARQAAGDYLRFVKSEDALSPFFLSTLYRICENLNVKMASCGLQNVPRGTPVENRPALLMLWPEEAVEKDVFLSGLDGGNEAYRFLYNKLFCRSLCPGSVSSEEDFVASLVSACDRVGITGQPLYFRSAGEDLPR